MKLEIEEAKGYMIVRCDGNVGGSAREDIDAAIHPMIEHHASRVLIDLSKVDRITSEGIGVFVTLVARANSKQSRVVFANPTPFVKAIFDTTKIIRFLETEESIEAGVARLLEPAAVDA